MDDQPTRNQPSSDDVPEGFRDTFETFFRQSARGSADRRVELTLTFREAALGAEREIEIERLERCSRCHGQGAAPGTTSQVCPACHGSGETRRIQQTSLGQFVNVLACERCQGRGRLVETPCPACQGDGRLRATTKITVTIPAGIEDGMQMRLSGEGDAGRAGDAPGNLYVKLSVRPDPIFQRDGDDLLIDLPLTLEQAAGGAVIDVPTLEGAARLHVPAGTETGRIFRLHGRGIANLRGTGRGDLVMTVRVLGSSLDTPPTGPSNAS
jgi:molecular chaperone DnaJ